MPISHRYLEAKRSVDDRALNARIWARLHAELEAAGNGPRIVDIGAGIGTGLERYLERGAPPPRAYTAVDTSRAFLDLAEERLRGRVVIAGRFVAATLAEFTSDPTQHGYFDLVLAHAFLDIVDLEPSLRSLVALARPGGWLYFPITFDGETIFEPSHPLDEEVLRRYHDSIGGDSKTGRKLFHALASHPVEILEIGSSDWIVRPIDRGYPAEEGFFLSHIIEMIEGAVGGEAASEWASARRVDIAEARLLYIAHQVDYLVRKHP